VYEYIYIYVDMYICTPTKPYFPEPLLVSFTVLICRRALFSKVRGYLRLLRDISTTSDWAAQTSRLVLSLLKSLVGKKEIEDTCRVTQKEALERIQE